MTIALTLTKMVFNKRVFTRCCLYLEHLIAGLALGLTLYSLYLIGLMLELPNGPDEQKLIWALGGLTLPLSSAIYAVFRAYCKPLLWVNSWVGLAVIVSLLVYSIIATAALLFFGFIGFVGWWPPGYC